MKCLLIIGAGDQGKIIFDEAYRQKKYNILGFSDLKKKINKKIISKNKKFFKVICSEENIPKKKNLYLILSINEPKKRKLIYNKIAKKYPKIKWATIISKDAKIEKDTIIGKGTFLGKGVISNRNSKIGSHCNINTGNIIEHDCILGDFVCTGPAVIIAGKVKIGDSCFLGMGSNILPGTNLSKETFIKAMSLVRN